MDPLLISGLAFVGVTGMVFAIASLFSEKTSNNVEDRLLVLAGKKQANEAELTRDALLKDGLDGLSGVFKSIAERFDLKLLFAQSDSPITPEVFVMVSIGCGVLGGVFCFLVAAQFAFVPLAAIVFCMGPLLWLMFRRGRRLKKFSTQLPEALALIARALRSGHSLASGIKVVCDEMQAPMSKEMNITYEEQNLGIPLDQALKGMYKRVPNLDLKFFATAVAIQRQSGGDLAEILDKISKVTRERQELLGHVQALTGEGRISGIVLMALPIAIFLCVWKMNPDYVMILFTDEMGRKMVAVAIALQILGAWSIKKIVQIKI
ncbi:MAG: secretion protein [Planctomycetota bacterium]|nr:MAG: secretion protein [Planctomycetota bacterium]